MDLPIPSLTVITDRHLCSEPLPETARKAIAGGADVIQLREKDLSDRELFDLAVSLREITVREKAMLIVNHSIDVALAAGADGIHLGWRSLKPQEARKVLGAGKLIGVSVHSLEELLQAEHGGADYVQLGPIFDTPSKRGKVAPLGCEALRDLWKRSAIPVIAVGGIKEENAAEVMAAGADGIAVISAVMAASDARLAACQLKRQQELGRGMGK